MLARLTVERLEVGIDWVDWCPHRGASGQARDECADGTAGKRNVITKWRNSLAKGSKINRAVERRRWGEGVEPAAAARVGRSTWHPPPVKADFPKDVQR